MAPRGFKLGMSVALLAMLWTQLSAQPPPCTPANIAALSSCLGFVMGSSASPSPACCSQLSATLQTQAQCLCAFLGSNAAQFGAMINQTQAVTLPSVCNIQAPPLSQCNAVAAGAPPAAATSEAQAPAPATTSTVSSTPSNDSPSATTTGTSISPSNVPSLPTVPSGGSKTVPATRQSTSDARSLLQFTPSMFLALMLVASCAWSFPSF